MDGDGSSRRCDRVGDVTLGPDRRSPADPDIGLTQLHPSATGLHAKTHDGSIEQLGIGGKAQGLLLNRAVHAHRFHVLFSQRAAGMGDAQTFLQQMIEAIRSETAALVAEPVTFMGNTFPP